MPNYPMNIWLIDENEFDSFTFTGGKVICIAEEPNSRFITHPAIVTAGALLPPFEAIQAELDGNMLESEALYTQYLQSAEADPYIITLVAAAIKQVPIGIMFGRDESNFQFPKTFINFMYKVYGLVFGLTNRIQPYVEEAFIPLDLARLYSMNMIDYQTFMERHPPLPIHYSIISKLAYDINPLVPVRDMQHYVEYFENVRKTVQDNGGKFLVDPLVAL